MESIDIEIAGQSYRLKGEETAEHLDEVAALVRRRVESLLKKNPSLGLQKAAMLAAFDFASQVIKGGRRASEYRSAVVSRAKLLLERVERELDARHPAG